MEGMTPVSGNLVQTELFMSVHEKTVERGGTICLQRVQRQ